MSEGTMPALPDISGGAAGISGGYDGYAMAAMSGSTGYSEAENGYLEAMNDHLSISKEYLRELRETVTGIRQGQEEMSSHLYQISVSVNNEGGKMNIHDLAGALARAIREESQAAVNGAY